MQSEQQHIRWGVPPHVHLKWRDWDDGSLVYHHEAGQTHHLNHFAAWVLQYLTGHPSTASEIAEQVRLEAGSAEVQGIDRIPALLERFAELGLIGPLVA
jgi:PqqD family protein of HPr-rel-A system